MERERSERAYKFFYPLLILAFAFILSNIKVKDPDAFIHLKLGEYAVQNIKIPDHDPFVYTYTQSQYNNSAWLSQVIYYIIFKLTGITGLIIFNAILVGLTYTVLFLITRAINLPELLSAIFVLTVCYASKERFVLRPHIFSLLFLSLTLFRLTKGKNGYSVTFLLYLLWTNMHAGFIFGIIVLFLNAVDSGVKVIFRKKRPEEFKPDFLNLLFAFAGTLLNPVPFAGYRFSRGLAELKFYGDVLEWRSLLESHYTFLIAVTVVCIIFSIFNFKRNSIRDWLTLIVFVPAGFWSWRNTYELLIIITPLSVSGATQLFNYFNITKKVKKLAFIEGIPLVLTLTFLFDFKMNDFYNQIGHGISQRYFPSEAIRFLKKLNPEGNIFNSFNFGGALLFELFPYKRIFIDGLSSGIAREFMHEYVRATEDGGFFEKIAEKYNITAIMVESDRGYIKRGIFNPEKWALIYWDDYAMILLRKEFVSHEMEIRIGDPSDVIEEAIQVSLVGSDYFMNELYRSKKIADSFMVNLALGILLKRQGKLDEAIDLLEQAFSKQPFSFLCMYMLGHSFKEAGYIEAARWMYRRIILLNGGISGFSSQPFFIPRKEIKKIKNELKYLEEQM